MHDARVPLARAGGLSLLACALLACGSQSETSEPTPAEPAPEPIAEGAPAAPQPTEPTEGPAEPVAALPDAPAPTAQPTVAPVALPESGLPPVTSGPAIRIESTLPVTTREVGRRRIPSVTLASPAAQASLDAWFERQSYCRGRVHLAIDGFVSYVCTYDEPASGSGLARLAMNARVLESGEVETVREEDVFLPGTDLRRMIPVWAGDPRAVQGEIGFTPTGAVVVPLDEGDDLLRLPWRTIAPYVRADGPLGPALAAQGLTLAPPGTSAPPPPFLTRALVCRDTAEAISIGARLPPEVRAGTRLRVGSEESLLLLPAGVDSAALGALGAPEEQRYLYGALAELVTVRVDRALELHESAGPRAPVVSALPAGTIAVAARGPIGARTSELGTGWVPIAAGGAGGWAQGRHVLSHEGCGAPAGEPGAIGGYAELTPDERFAWTLAPVEDGARTLATLFTLGEGCAIGEQVRRATAEGTVTELHLVRAAADGPEWLLVLVSAADLAEPARTVAVIGPSAGAAPLYTSTVDAPVVRLAERRGPDRAAGYFPITIASGESRTWLAWNGSAIDALTP
ncbi:MAG: hypothetical protein M5U28_30210 [Sandaracinaceae bacterium]|nr:hypothetical protein [Sandaracinaceae bacterium]